jgi:CubicO group peptidase (beta-lactamase class C family)
VHPRKLQQPATLHFDVTIIATIQLAVSQGLGSAASVQVGAGSTTLLNAHSGHRWTMAPQGQSPKQLAPTIDDKTLFDLASLTKPMATASIAMAMVSQGFLRLSQPVGHFFPAFSIDVTVADLLSHRAGCASHQPFYQHLWSKDFRAGGGNARDALVELAQRTPPAYAARSKNLYSDVGYILLGSLLERIGGASLDQLFARWVAEPLQLGSTGFIAIPAAQQVVAVATENCAVRGVVCGEVHDENCHAAGGIAGHAGLFGTVNDVGRFAVAVLNALNHSGNARVGAWRSEVVQQFFAPIENSSWRLGWDTPSSIDGVSHAGDRWPRRGGFGHLGFTGTSLWLDVEQSAYVALLTNRVHPRREPTTDAIKSLRRAVGDAASALVSQAV